MRFLMPRPGGDSDKLGNRYEGIWTIDSLLLIIEGDIDSITVEDIDKKESRGVEFVRIKHDGSRDYHSVKRQTTTNEWSLYKLTKPSESGRSILSDLFDKIKMNPTNTATFVSSTGANVIRELAETAKRSQDFNNFQTQLPENLQSEIDKYLIPVCRKRKEVYDLLNRLEIDLISETQLIKQVERHIRHLFYNPNNSLIDAVAIRTLLGDFILDKLKQTLNKKTF